MKLIETFNKHIEDTFSVSEYNNSKSWLDVHLDRLKNGHNYEVSFLENKHTIECLTFDWIKIGMTIYFNAGGVVEKAQILDVIVYSNCMGSLFGFKTTKGGVWYYEVRRTRKEAERTKVNCR